MSNQSLSDDDLFQQLKSVLNPPKEAIFDQIIERQDALTPLLLEEVAQFAANLDKVALQGKDYIRHVICLFLLAHLRNKAAYPLIIQLISHPGDKLIKLTGEVFTEALGRILASVYDGDLQPITTIVENPRLSPWIRSGALDSLMVLWKEDVLSREQVVRYLKGLMQDKLERKSSYVWDTIALIAYDLHPRELQSLLIQAIDDKLIDPMVLNKSSLATCVKDDLAQIIKNKENLVDGYIKEPIKELTWWLYPDEESLDKGIDYAAMSVPLADKKIIPGERGQPMGWRPQTVIRGTKKVGRNDPCFCGSGRKYKKCCGAN